MFNVILRNNFKKLIFFISILFLFNLSFLYSDNFTLAQNNIPSNSIDYRLLEPLDSNGDGTVSIKAGSINTYLNGLLRYLLIFVAIASGFYLVYGGIQYLTTDMNNLRMEGKETIKRVIIGLVFIFSIWTIFNSINPELLNNNFILSESRASEDANSSDPDTSNPLTEARPSENTPDGKIKVCVEGFVVVSGIEVCSTIKDKVKNMIDAAAKDNIILTGSGRRSVERQVQLRRQNCGTTEYDIYKKPSGQCNPETAIPGRSAHEQGLAIDFQNTCFTANRNTSNARNCAQSGNKNFLWLEANAKNYGFRNLVNGTEPWHWSTTGR
jgi:hypothetical protein